MIRLSGFKLGAILFIAVLFFGCNKISEDLPKQCIIPYIDFVAYHINPNTLEVGFTGITATNGTINSYRWDFGDGTSSSNLTQSLHLYPQLSASQPIKNYNIKFTASNSCGSAYWTKSISVGPCLADANFNYTSINDSTIIINNLTTSATNTTYIWNFGDGTSSTTNSNSFTHSYRTSGTYLILLKATNSCGENQYYLNVTIQKLATLITNPATNIAATTATCGGNITNTGGLSITNRGICWSTSSTVLPTYPNSLNSSAGQGGIGAFTASLSNLVVVTTYYYRAFAVSSAGVAYGQRLSFTTIPSLPLVTTLTPVSSISNNTAVASGNVSGDGGSTVTSRGIVWSTNTNPDISLSTKLYNGTGLGSYFITIPNLNSGTLYHIRAFATNSVGTNYGLDVSFTTLGTLPTVQTTSVNSITQTTAIASGNVVNTGGVNVTERGFCLSANINPTINDIRFISGSGLGSYSSNITGLAPVTQYHIRAYAINSIGVNYGNDLTFTTINYSLGSTGPAGGLIFYDNGSYSLGWRYLEAAPSDQSTLASWGCYGVSISGSTSTALGSGMSNTTSIVTACASAGIAAKICDQLSLNGYSDWFLPSYTELNKMYINLRQANLGGFSNTYYWSSTQISSTLAYIELFNLGTGGFYQGGKSSSYRVRAIRRF